MPSIGEFRNRNTISALGAYLSFLLLWCALVNFLGHQAECLLEVGRLLNSRPFQQYFQKVYFLSTKQKRKNIVLTHTEYLRFCLGGVYSNKHGTFEKISKSPELRNRINLKLAVCFAYF